MEQRKHHIICCNDSIEAIVFGFEAEAKAKMEELAAAYFHRNESAFEHDYAAFRQRCYWHLHDAPYSEGKGVVRGYEISACIDDGNNVTALKWECDSLAVWREGQIGGPDCEVFWTLYLRDENGMAHAIFDHAERDKVLALYQQLTGVQYEWPGDAVTAELPAHTDN